MTADGGPPTAEESIPGGNALRCHPVETLDISARESIGRRSAVIYLPQFS